MREIRVFCDRCKKECGDNYYDLNIVNHTDAGSYTTKEIIELCPSCYGKIGFFIDADFCVPIQDDFEEYL